MDDIKVITKLEDIKILADINRFAIMDCLATHKLLTTSEVSEKTGIPYSRASYGLRKLEEAGMVRVAETRIKFGINEKYYSLAAKEFQVGEITEEDGNSQEATNNRKLLHEIMLKSLTREYLNNTYGETDEEEDPNVGEITVDNIYLRREDIGHILRETSDFFEELLKPYREREDDAQKPFTLAKVFFKRK